MSLSPEDLEDLRHAKNLLDTPGLALRIANLIGSPLDKGYKLLPAKWSETVNNATVASLEKAMDVVLVTMDDSRRKESASNIFHKVAAAATGAAGGAFGLAALSLELPLSTILILRSIADIARNQGEDIRSPETRLACLEVFALGGPSPGDDAAEIGYFVVRTAMSKAVSEAARHMFNKGAARKGAPALVNFIAQVAARFGVVVSEKAAAQAIPVVGAAGGAAINTIFIDHFQNIARGHFIVRRLERTYGEELVRETYEKL